MIHSPAFASSPSQWHDVHKPLLQLSATRGRLALELAQKFDVGPLQVSKLVWLLEGLRFPLDLSGGVQRFRHRRGCLDYLQVDAPFDKLSSYVTPRIREALHCPSGQVQLLPQDTGLTVGVTSSQFSVAFSLLFAPSDSVIRWVVTSARACGLDYHSHAAALRVTQALLGKAASREGSIFFVNNWLVLLIREVLLDAGARLPRCDAVRWNWQTHDQGLQIVASSQLQPSTPAHVLRALQLATITQQADDALIADNIDRARHYYCNALDAAPRHPDIAMRIGEIDNLLHNHAPSTLAMIVEAMPAVDAGVVAAPLLGSVGDTQAMIVALTRAAASEPYAPLAARMLGEASRNVDCLQQKHSLLDDALALCPGCDSLRWQRAKARLHQGLTDLGLEDLGRLEAGALGSDARFEVCLRSGNLLMDARLPQQAREFFDRALRYCPGSAHASASLAHAMFAIGEAQRATALLSRAVSLSDKKQKTEPTLRLQLAIGLAEYCNDLPAAIFQARKIPFGFAETIAARALEARWRNQLGDVVGASYAFEQARAAASHLPIETIAPHTHWLVEAAIFEFEQRHDPKMAKAHLIPALRARPKDTNILSLFRKVANAEANAQKAEHERNDPPRNPIDLSTSADSTHISESPRQPIDSVVGHCVGLAKQQPDLPVEIPFETPFNTSMVKTDASPLPLEPDTLFENSDEQALIELQIEQLTSQVRANPENNHAVIELCDLLQRHNRWTDLLALVSARLEETPHGETRPKLEQMRIAAIHGLIERCRMQGRTQEATMYEMLLGNTNSQDI